MIKAAIYEHPASGVLLHVKYEQPDTGLILHEVRVADPVGVEPAVATRMLQDIAEEIENAN